MKIEKEREDKQVANTMIFLDEFGKEIPNAISYDDMLHIVVVYEPIVVY